MIYSITGLLRQVAPTYCVVEACGIGYQCSASTHTLSSLPARGQEVTLLTPPPAAAPLLPPPRQWRWFGWW